jgi:hypothetical protein
MYTWHSRKLEAERSRLILVWRVSDGVHGSLGGMVLSYKAILDETTTLLPFCQATVSGLYAMRPPQAIPAQPVAIGATI